MRQFLVGVYSSMLLFLVACNNESATIAVVDTIFVNEADSIDHETIPLDSLSDGRPLLDVIICTENLPIPPIMVKKNVYFQRPDGGYDSSTNWQVIEPLEQISQNLFTFEQFIWPQDTLLVTFVDSRVDEVVGRRVMETAKKWEAYCGIVFQFGNFAQPDISISFRYGVNESCIGSTSRYENPSMKLAGLRRETPQSVYDKYVLHEFGHALGMFHEHQNPSEDIAWNEEFLIDYYKKPPYRWTENDVKRNIINKPRFSGFKGSELDLSSIMLYEILPQMVKDRRYVTTGRNSLLQKDMHIIDSIYPKKQIVP